MISTFTATAHIFVTAHRDFFFFAALTPKQLLGPSQKEFMTIATFLFQKVDPNFAFGKDKKQDDEVIANFKTLGYAVFLLVIFPNSTGRDASHFLSFSSLVVAALSDLLCVSLFVSPSLPTLSLALVHGAQLPVQHQQELAAVGRRAAHVAGRAGRAHVAD